LLELGHNSEKIKGHKIGNKEFGELSTFLELLMGDEPFIMQIFDGRDGSPIRLILQSTIMQNYQDSNEYIRG